MERHQYAHPFIHLLTRCILESIKQGALTTRKVFTGCPDLANGLEHLLHQQILVRDERIVIDKFDIVAIVGQLCGGGRVKGQLVAQNIAFLDKQIGQLIFGRCGFF
ncbi:hypothetical protein D3C79_638010 [compost metagenome]